MTTDFDNFKTVNDSFVHGEGDRILRLAATAIKNISGPCHVVAKIVGDELVIIFRNTRA